jgi:acyl-homoserine lactone synthase
MILVESCDGDVTTSPVLRAMFRARKEIFVDLLKWDVPVLERLYEVDEFDNERSDYLIVSDRAGAHLGSARLLETTAPHILGTLFPQLCAGELPAGPQIAEITRFCLDRNQSARARRETRNRLVSALVSFALERGIHTYTGVAELGWLQQILAFGWNCQPLGPPQRFECGVLGALAIHIDRETPGLLERNGIWMPEPLRTAKLAEAA